MATLLEPINRLLDTIFYSVISPLAGLLGRGLELVLHTPLRWLRLPQEIEWSCGASPEANYILMRFAGDGGTDHGRDLRLDFLTALLARLIFTCERGGELLGAVRLLDMVLHDKGQIEPMVDGLFFAGTYDFSKE